jgi:ABC-type glycerol-3-phosphate transport system permease component
MIPGILGLVPLFMIVKRLGLLDTYWALVLPYVAGGQVMGIFLLRTFFAAIPNDLFDASRIDGAGDFRTFASVAVPLCKPMLATVHYYGASSWNDLIWPLIVIQDNQLKSITIGLLRSKPICLRSPLHNGGRCSPAMSLRLSRCSYCSSRRARLYRRTDRRCAEG